MKGSNHLEINENNSSVGEMKSSAHFGADDLQEKNETFNIIGNSEILMQLAKSNDLTKKLAEVFSGLVSKVKELEEKNGEINKENEELRKSNSLKERIILDKNHEIEAKDKRIEEVLEHSLRLEKEMIKNRAKISQAMNIAFEKGESDLVEFIERDILSVSSKPG